MIAIDDNGNFIVDANGRLTTTSRPADQNFVAEVRCIQGTWPVDLTYGRNVLIWTISQSPVDRCGDLARIGSKYTVVKSVVYNAQTETYEVQA